MRLSVVVALIGVAIVVVAVILFFLGAPASALNTSINEALSQLNRTSATSLAPGENLSLTYPQTAIVLINSSEPLRVEPSSLRVVSQGLITAVAVAANTTVYIINNYSHVVSFRYAVVTISPSLSQAVFFMLTSLGLGFLGFILLVVGAVLYVLKK
ncbi:MAG: hypothetical protein ABWJ97_08000 [Thermoproteus sp.]